MKSKALPQHIIERMNPEDRKALKVQTTDERLKSAEKKGEAWIQKTVEAYCVQLGFERLTRENIHLSGQRKDFPARGWQYHLSPLGAKKNPMLPDITLFDRLGRYLWLELKTVTGKPSELQEIMIGTGQWFVAYGADQAVEIIKEWAEG